jgi:hypothetical protein
MSTALGNFASIWLLLSGQHYELVESYVITARRLCDVSYSGFHECFVFLHMIVVLRLRVVPLLLLPLCHYSFCCKTVSSLLLRP